METRSLPQLKEDIEQLQREFDVKIKKVERAARLQRDFKIIQNEIQNNIKALEAEVNIASESDFSPEEALVGERWVSSVRDAVRDWSTKGLKKEKELDQLRIAREERKEERKKMEEEKGKEREEVEGKGKEREEQAKKEPDQLKIAREERKKIEEEKGKEKEEVEGKGKEREERDKKKEEDDKKKEEDDKKKEEDDKKKEEDEENKKLLPYAVSELFSSERIFAEGMDTLGNQLNNFLTSINSEPEFETFRGSREFQKIKQYITIYSDATQCLGINKNPILSIISELKGPEKVDVKLGVEESLAVVTETYKMINNHTLDNYYDQLIAMAKIYDDFSRVMLKAVNAYPVVKVKTDKIFSKKGQEGEGFGIVQLASFTVLPIQRGPRIVMFIDTINKKMARWWDDKENNSDFREGAKRIVEDSTKELDRAVPKGNEKKDVETRKEIYDVLEECLSYYERSHEAKLNKKAELVGRATLEGKPQGKSPKLEKSREAIKMLSDAMEVLDHVKEMRDLHQQASLAFCKDEDILSQGRSASKRFYEQSKKCDTLLETSAFSNIAENMMLIIAAEMQGTKDLKEKKEKGYDIYLCQTLNDMKIKIKEDKEEYENSFFIIKDKNKGTTTLFCIERNKNDVLVPRQVKEVDDMKRFDELPEPMTAYKNHQELTYSQFKDLTTPIEGLLVRKVIEKLESVARERNALKPKQALFGEADHFSSAVNKIKALAEKNYKYKIGGMPKEEKEASKRLSK